MRKKLKKYADILYDLTIAVEDGKISVEEATEKCDESIAFSFEELLEMDEYINQRRKAEGRKIFDF